jgi:prepilin-type N-terminal cleavage/methylation domain-containing protein
LKRSGIHTGRQIGSRNRGFTLVEILVALFIMVASTVLIFGSYFQIVRVKKKGEAKLDRMRQSDWVMDQLVVALRSSVFLDNNPKKCGFWLEDDSSEFDADVISWVTSSAAFMPPNGQLAYGLHRIFLSIEDDDKGEPALHASGYAYLADSDADDFEEPEPWLISRRVKGLNCRVYDDFNKEWADEYEKDNAVPGFVEITLTILGETPDSPVEEIRRVVQLPAGSFAKNRRRMGGGQAGEPQAGEGEGNAPGGSPNQARGSDPRIIQDNPGNNPGMGRDGGGRR